MKIYRLSLSNYRVFEEPIELEIPSGLVGIYGPNGAGKSYLIESIPWVLYGRSRTSIQDIRTSGSDSESRAELEFEHEDHLYTVSRIVSKRGIVKARAWVDQELAADGVKETNRFIHSILGMDADAFRASAFAEQKQVAAFSDSAPAERQKLVLSLMGITPLDLARDLSRGDWRAFQGQLNIARVTVPDLAQIESERLAKAEELGLVLIEVGSVGRNKALLDEKLSDALIVLRELEHKKLLSDQIIAVGREKRKLYDQLIQRAGELSEAKQRLADIDQSLKIIPGSDLDVSALDAEIESLKRSISNISIVMKAFQELDLILAEVGCNDIPMLLELLSNSAASIEACNRNVILIRDRRDLLSQQIASIKERKNAEEEKCRLLNNLGNDACCPTCGQVLGEDFQRHLNESKKELVFLSTSIDQRELSLNQLNIDLKQSEHSLRNASLENDKLRNVETRARMVKVKIDNFKQSDCLELPEMQRKLSRLEQLKNSAQSDQVKYNKLIAKREEIQKFIDRNQSTDQNVLSTKDELDQLKVTLNGLAFDPRDVKRQEELIESLRDNLTGASRKYEEIMSKEMSLKSDLNTLNALLDQAQTSLLLVGELESKVEVSGRIADYLTEFRKSIVADLGPRLALTAASIFSELTESEYDQLDVDTSTWQLRISDGGNLHDLNRFSGSERDLANLAFRIAISEQIGISFGQQVGLLVLDEVFGPLDDQRKFIMLGALETLKARFNQMIVVTHGVDIKEQLPAAIEVVKLGNRRATARVL